MPQQPIPPTLECSLPSGGVAIASDFFGLFSIDAIADPTGMANFQAPPGPVSATQTWMGDWLLTLFLNPSGIPPQFLPAYWSVCIQPEFTGTGTGSVTGSIGPGTVAGACDFAHATPFPSNGMVTIPVDITVAAQGDGEEIAHVTFNGFDSAGNPVGIGAFSLVPLADLPEPGAAIPMAVLLAGLCASRFRRQPR